MVERALSNRRWRSAARCLALALTPPASLAAMPRMASALESGTMCRRSKSASASSSEGCSGLNMPDAKCLAAASLSLMDPN